MILTAAGAFGHDALKPQCARRRLGALYVDATEAIVGDREQSVEAFSWFRNDRSDIDRHRDGLTLDGQGLGGLTLVAAKLLPAQSRTDGDAFWVKATRETHTATAAAYGVIVVDDVLDRTAQVTGGPPVSGSVDVTVTHRNPPPGVTVAAKGAGDVNVAPPRTEQQQLAAA